MVDAQWLESDNNETRQRQTAAADPWRSIILQHGCRAISDAGRDGPLRARVLAVQQRNPEIQKSRNPEIQKSRSQRLQPRQRGSRGEKAPTGSSMPSKTVWPFAGLSTHHDCFHRPSQTFLEPQSRSLDAFTHPLPSIRSCLCAEDHVGGAAGCTSSLLPPLPPATGKQQLAAEAPFLPSRCDGAISTARTGLAICERGGFRARTGWGVLNQSGERQ